MRLPSDPKKPGGAGLFSSIRDGVAPGLLDRDRDEADFSLSVRDEEEGRLLALLLQRLDATGHVGRRRHRLLPDLDDHLAHLDALVGGGGGRIDARHDDALDGVLDVEALAHLVAQPGKLEAEDPARRARHVGRRLVERGLLLAVVVLEPPQRHRLHDLLALAHEGDVDGLADRRVGDDARQIARLLHLLAVELHDDVADLEAGGLCRALVVDAGDERPARRAEVERLGGRLVDVLDAYAEPAAAGLAELAQLLDHRHGGRGRHRKADADRAAGRRQDRRVDADHLAVHVEQRSARVAFVDRGVGLDVVVIRAGLDVPAARRDDAGRDRAAEAERIADRDDPVARPHLVGVAERHGLERLFGLHAQHGEVDLRILADDLGLEALAVREDDADVVRVADDVVVGDDDPRRIDDEARAERVRAALTRAVALPTRPALAALSAAVEEFLEQILERRAGRQLRQRPPARLDRRRGRDVDARRYNVLGEVGEGFRRRARPGLDREERGRQSEPPDDGRHEATAGGRRRGRENVHESHGTSLIWSDPLGSARSGCIQARLRPKRDSPPQAPNLRTAHTITTPSTAEAIPTRRMRSLGVFAASIMARLTRSGKAANRSPSTARASPRAAARSRMRHGYWVGPVGAAPGEPAPGAGATAAPGRRSAGAVVGAPGPPKPPLPLGSLK